MCYVGVPVTGDCLTVLVAARTWGAPRNYVWRERESVRVCARACVRGEGGGGWYNDHCVRVYVCIFLFFFGVCVCVANIF